MGSFCVCSVMMMVPTRSTNQYSKFPATDLSIMKDVTLRSSTEMLYSNFSASSPSKRTCLFDAKSCSRRRYRCRSQLIADFAPAASAAYGILLLTGGIFAYARSRSNGSLLGGVTGGALMFAAYSLMQASETKEIGDAIAFGSALLFAAVFGIRFVATRKVIPAGLLLIFSISSMAVSFSAYLQDKH